MRAAGKHLIGHRARDGHVRVRTAIEGGIEARNHADAERICSVRRVVAQSEQRSIFSFRNLNFGAWAIFAYVGAEVSIGTFLTNYISDTLSLSIEDANAYVTYYWGGMLAGRLVGSYLLQRIKPSLVLTVCATAAIVLVLLSVSSHGTLAVWSMIGVGLFNSVMFAIIFSLSVEGLGRYTTKASGILSTAIAGGAIVSFSQGYLKDHTTWAVAFLIPVVCYAYIAFFGINGYKRKSL